MTPRGRRSGLWVLAGLILIWAAAGIRTFSPDGEFGVLQGPGFLGFPRLAKGTWTISLPGVSRLVRYPKNPVVLPLPQAEEAMIPSADGSRYGFRGWITLRLLPEKWRDVSSADHGGGARDLVLAAVRIAGEGLDRGVHRNLDAGSFQEELRNRLEKELAAMGGRLRDLNLDSLDYLMAREGGATALTDTRLLIVGLDGADWLILDPLLEQGKMPNLRRLIDHGVRAKLLTISPMLSPVIWTTIATGVEPGRHGILDFLVQKPDGTGRQPVTSLQRRTPTFWEMLGDAGATVGVVGWWATWPAGPVNGYLVTERIAYQLFDFKVDPDDSEGKTWPPGLYADIRPWIVSPDSISWERTVGYLEGDRKKKTAFDREDAHRLEEFRTLLASGDSYVGIARNLSTRFRPHLEAVYLEGTDTVGHLFMSFRPPRLPGVDGESYKSFRSVVDRYYQQADRYLGELLEGRGKDWTVMVLSDHGFASDATRPHSADSRIGHGQAASWHRKFGMLVLSGKHVRPGAVLEQASVYDIAPTVLALFGQPVPSSWPGKVLAGALDPGFLEKFPVRFRNNDPVRDAAGAGVPGGSGEGANQDLIEKLSSLGYISPGAAGGGDESVTARNNTGVALMAERKFAQAEEQFREGLRAGPAEPTLIVNLGLALLHQGKREEAGNWFKKALKYPHAFRIAAHNLAAMSMEDGDMDRAESYLRSVLAQEPDAVEVLTTLGQVLSRKGDKDGAAATWKKAAELDPDMAQPRNELGNLARSRRNNEEAERWYKAAIDADPYFMGAYNNLALVYQDEGRIQEAIRLYGRALEKAPRNAVVMNNLASLYYATGEKEEAEKLWRRAIQADPAYPSPYNNLAGIEISRKELDLAEKYLMQALELDPEYGDARVNLALILRSRGQVEEARLELVAAGADPKSRPQALLQLGYLEMEAGRLEEGLDAMEKARKLLGDSPNLLNVMGEAHRVLGDQETALELWNRSLALDPGQAALQDRVRRLEESRGGG